MFRLLLALAAVLMMSALASPALAATTGLVRGTITVDGKAAPHASVTLQGQGSRFTVTTDAAGTYVFPLVPFGQYRLTAHASNAHDLTVFVTVTSDTVATIDVPL